MWGESCKSDFIISPHPQNASSYRQPHHVEKLDSRGLCYNEGMTKRVGRRSQSPNHYPRGSYRPPYPYPPTTYPYPPRNRSAEIITISLLVAAFMLLGLGGMLWIVQSRLAFGPTPTPTPTRGAPLTATPDFMSTRVAEDFLTQQAYQMALLGTTTPTPFDVIPPMLEEPTGTPEMTNTPVTVRLPNLNVPFTPSPEATTLPADGLFPLETPPSNIVNLPIVVDSSPLATPTPAQVAELPTDIPLPTESAPTEVPTATPTETPTETPTATPTLPIDTPSPTPTETLLPPTPTATTIPPGQPFVVASLTVYVESDVVSLRLGPSSVYSTTIQLARGTRLTAIGRNPSGEWLYVCCIENQSDQGPAWARQAQVRPRDNTLQSGAPEGANPNDARYLPMLPAPGNLPIIPTPIPPGPDDFPLYRYDRHASGRVDFLPNPPLNPTWGTEASAGAELGSPVAVVGTSLLVGSADNHLYSFERMTGSQRWRLNLCQDGCRQVRLAPMIYENEIFIADQNRTVWALRERSGPPLEAEVLWRVSLAQSAISSFNIFSQTLFLATGEGANHTLVAMHRDNGAVVWAKSTTGPGLRYPAIGDQLIYAADGVVIAYDVITGDLVWQNNDAQNIIAGPVYGSPGPSSIAELYVVAGNNRIYALDANTGVELWNIDNGEAATSLALNESFLFVAGDGYVKAISRQDRNQRWRSSIVGGPVMGGPLVDANRVLVVTQSGNVQMLENQSGSAISVPSIASFVGGAPAVSGPYIFVPGTDGRLYELLGNQ